MDIAEVVVTKTNKDKKGSLPIKTDAAKKKDSSSEEDSSSDEEEPPLQSKGRGRPAGVTSKVNYWTRIFSLNYRPVNPEEKFDIEDDLRMEEVKWNELMPDEGDGTWAIFNPDRFCKQNQPLKMEDYVMAEKDLNEHAE